LDATLGQTDIRHQSTDTITHRVSPMPVTVISGNCPAGPHLPDSDGFVVVADGEESAVGGESKTTGPTDRHGR
jgi:hypothetical protein